MKSPVMTLLAMIALFLILILPSSVSGQSDVFEFDAVVLWMVGAAHIAVQIQTLASRIYG